MYPYMDIKVVNTTGKIYESMYGSMNSNLSLQDMMDNRLKSSLKKTLLS